MGLEEMVGKVTMAVDKASMTLRNVTTAPILLLSAPETFRFAAADATCPASPWCLSRRPRRSTPRSRTRKIAREYQHCSNKGGSSSDEVVTAIKLVKLVKLHDAMIISDRWYMTFWYSNWTLLSHKGPSCKINFHIANKLHATFP